MNLKGSTVIKFLVCSLLAVFLIHQLYSMVYKPITTATAVYSDTYDGIDVTGYFVRDERPISYNITGAERYLISDGEKISKSGVIAEVYSDSKTALAYSEADELQKKIDALSSVGSASDPSSVDLETVNQKINRTYFSLLNETQNGDFSNTGDTALELLTLINKKQVLAGEAGDTNSGIQELKTKRNSVLSGLASPVRTITADESGYFVSGTDGLEQVLDISQIDSFDINIFKKLENATVNNNAFGKIVTSYNWYIIAKMDGDTYLNFSKGDKVTLKTPLEGCEEISAEVYKAESFNDKNEAMIIFSCSTMNGQIAMTRSSHMTIVTKEYSGIRISNKSIRVVNGQTGVYIVQGSVVKFKPVKIIYTASNFSLCEKNEESDGNMIRLYDEVIEKGKNLYDGKYIN